MKNRKFEDYIILVLVLFALAFISNYENPTITGFAQGGEPGPPGGGGPPGQSGKGTVSEGGGVGVQKIVGIYPIYPVNEETLKNGDYEFLVKITYGGSFTADAKVTVNSTLFGIVDALYTEGITSIYNAKVTIKDIQKGKYRVRYKAEDKEKEEHEIFINLNPELKIETTLNNKYSKGENIKFSGIIKDYKNESQKNVDITVKGFYIGQLFEKNITTDNNGKFSIEYLVSYADPVGIWDITISAKDKYGNSGTIVFHPEIKMSGIANYIINFMSPITESSFKRGEIVPISIELKEKESLVENAKVTFFSPKGTKIDLKETGKGIYSIDYIIGNTDPLGDVRFKVEATKQIKEGVTKVGGESTLIKILSSEMNFDIQNPSSDTAYTNSRLKFYIKLSYVDGSLVKGSNVKVDISNNKTIKLLETEPGIYSGYYLVNEEDLGILNLKISAEDFYQNIGSTELVIYVRQRGFVGNLLALFYEQIIIRYWWAITTIIAALLLYYRTYIEKKYLNYNLLRIKKEQKDIRLMQIDTEKKYYNEGSLSKIEFKELMQNYEKRLADLKEKGKDIEENLGKFKKK